MKNITKKFPGIIANDNVTFDLKKGEIHALLGENGAGKSTLMSVLFGMYRPDEGEIYKEGTLIEINSPNDANDHRIGMVHQHFKLVENFTILDNIILGVEKTNRGFIDRKSVAADIEEIGKIYKLDVDPYAFVNDITVGMQQRTEILKMLYRNNEILIFDEPTAVLTPQEIDQLMVTMKNLAKEGKSIIFITHKLDEIMEICDRVTVLRRGRVTGTVNVAETSKEELSRLMIGRDLDLTLEIEKQNYDDSVLVVDSLSIISPISKKAVVDNASFNVKRGEIVCIAGIDGNGQSELVYALTGIIKPHSGSIYLNYEDITKKSIRYRNDNGMSHIPEDRHRYGLILDDTLENNLILKKYHKEPYQKYGIINRKEINLHAKRLIEQYDIRSSQGASTISRYMSGGNQQKAIIAREVDKNSDLIIAVQAVRGLDVGAVDFAHRQLVEKRNEGSSILLVSLDLDEVFSVSERVLVMYKGKIVKDVLTKDTTVEEIGLYMAGVKEDEIVNEDLLKDLQKIKERKGL